MSSKTYCVRCCKDPCTCPPGKCGVCKVECVGKCLYKPRNVWLDRFLITVRSFDAALVKMPAIITALAAFLGYNSLKADCERSAESCSFSDTIQFGFSEKIAPLIAIAVVDELQRRDCLTCNPPPPPKHKFPPKAPPEFPPDYPTDVKIIEGSSVQVRSGRWDECDRYGYRFSYPVGADVTDDTPFADLGFFGLYSRYEQDRLPGGCSSALVSRIWRDRGVIDERRTPRSRLDDREDGQAPYVYFYSAPINYDPILKDKLKEMTVHVTFLRDSGVVKKDAGSNVTTNVGVPAKIEIGLKVLDGRRVTDGQGIIELVSKVRFLPGYALPRNDDLPPVAPVFQQSDLVKVNPCDRQSDPGCYP